MRYPNKFKEDVILYGDKFGDDNAALQFGVSCHLIQDWRSSASLLNGPEKKRSPRKVVKTSSKKVVDPRDNIDVNQRFNDELSQWVMNRLDSDNRPTLQQISLKGLQLAKRFGRKKFIPTVNWGYFFLQSQQRRHLRKKWQLQIQKEKAKTAVKAKNRTDNELNEELSQWVVEELKHGRRPTLREIHEKGRKIASRLGDGFNHSPNWGYYFLRRMNLTKMWRAQLQKEKMAVSNKKQDVEQQFNEELSQWILKGIRDGFRPTLQQICHQGLQLATRLGKASFYPRSGWGYAFLKKMNLKHVWQSQLKKEKESGSNEQSLEQRFNNKLSQWVVKRLKNGHRPPLRQVSLKGLQIATQLGKKKFIPSINWGFHFLRRVNLSEMWQSELRKEKTEIVSNEDATLEKNLEERALRAHRLLLKWLRQKLDGGDRPTQLQISSKGLEIERSLGMKRRNSYSAWGRKFLVKTKLLGKWNRLLRMEKKQQDKRCAALTDTKLTINRPTNDKALPSKDEALPTTDKALMTDDKVLMEKAMKYAELHGNRVAAVKFGIPEKSFYEYLMKNSQEDYAQVRPICGDKNERLKDAVKYAEIHGNEEAMEKFNVSQNSFFEYIIENSAKSNCHTANVGNDLFS